MIRYAPGMRVLLLLFGLALAACSLSSGDDALRAEPYCMGPPQSRSAYLAANFEAVISDVRERRVALVNQPEPGVVRVARQAGGVRCHGGEETITLGEVAERLSQRSSGDIGRCRMLGRVSAYDPVELFEQLGLLGISSGGAMTDADLTIEAHDQCSVVEPIVRALAPDIQWTSVTDVRAP